MPSIRQELEGTGTARWYDAAHSAQRAAAWSERVRCYHALSAVLAEHAPAGPAGGASACRSQPPIQLPGLLTKVAAHAHFASAEPVYKRWRHKQDGQPIARLAGSDRSVKPVAALVAEAKVAAFWPYREGVIKVAGAFDMTVTEWAAAYLRALAAWASDNRPLAACHPAGPPGCVREDMQVFAAYRARAAGRLAELAGVVVGHVLEDASITPLGAFNAVRDEAGQLLAAPQAALPDRVMCSIAELCDHIARQGDGQPVLTAGEADRILSLLTGLGSLLAGRHAPGSRPDEEAA